MAVNRKRVEALRESLRILEDTRGNPRTAIGHIQDELTKELLGEGSSRRRRRASSSTSTPRKKRRGTKKKTGRRKGKLSGKAKRDFLERMAKGRRKARKKSR